MRDIKFRAYVKEIGAIYDVYELYSDGGVMVVNYDFPLSNGDIELMQYTGLKDKNGVEIFEGDIVSCEYLAPDERYVAIGEVVWCNSDSAQYKVNDNFDESDPLQEWYSGCEVIGNIYENPELLKAPN